MILELLLKSRLNFLSIYTSVGKVQDQAYFQDIQDGPVLSGRQREHLDRVLDQDELWFSLKGMRRGSSPGTDGLPADLYKILWKMLWYYYIKYIKKQ